MKSWDWTKGFAGHWAMFVLIILINCDQTCAKVPKRFEILGSLSPRSGTLMDLGPCTSFLPWDSGNPGPQNCVMPQDPGNPGPEDFDMQ